MNMKRERYKYMWLLGSNVSFLQCHFVPILSDRVDNLMAFIALYPIEALNKHKLQKF